MLKIKLLIFHPALAPYRIDLFNALAENFDAKFYFSCDNLKDQKFDQQQLRSQCKFDFNLLKKGFEIGNRSVRLGIYHIIKKNCPEIIICSEYSQVTMFVLIIKIMFRLKYKIYTISDDSLDLSIKRKGLRKWLRNKTSHYLAGIIFPSETVCNWYHQQVNNNVRLFALPIVHDNDTFRNKLQKSLVIAKQNLINYKLANKKIFLFVGRLVKIKNAHLLIKAYAESLAKLNDSALVIIGAGEEYDNLKKLAQKYSITDQCLLPGRFEGEELYAWYNIAQYLILPSYQEPYGAVVNEALIAGCKVICSKLAGASELITPVNGYTFNPLNKCELANLLKKANNEIKLTSNLEVKPDLMPFQLNQKTEALIKFLEN